MTCVNGQIRPDFIIIGAMKSGTTTLYRLLAEHPEIGMSRDKETDFFVAEKNFRLGAQWYSNQFTPGHKIYGEASTNYTKADDFQGVPKRIKAYCPGVKLIYVVRDPVDRFKSQYRHSWSMGGISLTPAQLMKTSEYNHILNCSRYARQIDAYLEQFRISDILIVDFYRFTAESGPVLDEIYEFLGVTVGNKSQIKVHNDHRHLAKISPIFLRVAQSQFGRMTTRFLGRAQRDTVRKFLALGKNREPPEFHDADIERIRSDLKADVDRFRVLSGLGLTQWSV